jgi:ssDNA-binding Zn-finger/Zn-ribbon topoisomerase 1
MPIYGEHTCPKCGHTMTRFEAQPARSFGMFSGFTDTTATSCTGTITTPTTVPPEHPPQLKKPIKIVKYVCPNCRHEYQERE